MTSEDQIWLSYKTFSSSKHLSTAIVISAWDKTSKESCEQVRYANRQLRRDDFARDCYIYDIHMRTMGKTLVVLCWHNLTLSIKQLSPNAWKFKLSNEVQVFTGNVKESDRNGSKLIAS